MREQQAARSSITTPSAKTQPVMANYSPYGEIRVGDQVEVKEDLSPNKCSHGGIAYVKEKEERREEFEFTVEYIIDCTRENKIPYKRLKLVSLLYPENSNANRPKRLVTEAITNEPAGKELDTNTTKSIVELLQEGRSSGRGKGWRAKQLNVAQKSSNGMRSKQHNIFLLKGASRLHSQHMLLTRMLRTVVMV